MGNCGSRPGDGEVFQPSNNSGSNQNQPIESSKQKSLNASSPQHSVVDNQIQIKIESPAVRTQEFQSSTSGAEIASMLKNVPLLAKLSASEREALGNAFIEKTYPDGHRMVVEGDIGREFFIIKEGRARVTKFDAEKKLDTELCQLTRHDYFGERALIESNSKRAATIAALNGPITCFVMNRDKFVALFGKDKLNVTFAKRAAVSAETFDPKKEQKENVEMSNADRSKSADQKSMILNVVRSSLLFQNLDAQQQEKVVDEMWLKTVNPGETIIKQGDLGDYWYVVEHGKFDIFVSRKGSEPVKVASRDRASAFGELALLYNAPRAATVTAGIESSVWVLDRWTFRRLLTTGADAKLAEYERFLRGVSSFESLLDYERSKIAEALEEVAFPEHHQICKQGEPGDSFFILKKGEVVVTKTEAGVSLEVARYKPGDCFGEQALISKTNIRAATCTSLGPVNCLYLNRDAFSILMGPMEDIFKRRVEGYAAITSPNNAAQTNKDGKIIEGRKVQVSSAADKEENYLNKDIKLKDLIIIGTLGKGSFGHVQLVKDPKTGQTYALKTVGKAQVVALGQQEHIMSEKKVMAALHHSFLIKLHATFKDHNCLYFLLEPSLGGELFSVLRAKTFFDEPTARFFAAGVILAFEYMHSKGIIYRDLKPENLLLDSGGYLKITDFGFAKKVGDSRTWTLCGTPDYLAPEVVSGQGHGKGVDWWTLGILIYEMLASYPPFYDEDPMKTYAKIMQGALTFPMHFSKPAVDLIKKLLHPKPTKRLGVVNGGAKLIKEHPWFSGFDWNAFEQRKMTAPIILPVKSSEDLSNFEEYPEDENGIEDYVVDPKNPDWEKDF